MRIRPTLAAAFAPSLLLMVVTCVAVRAMAEDNEAKLATKIGQESDPVKKAKLEVKLGRLRLQEAFTSYTAGKYEDCWKRLGSYQDTMDQAWTDLQASGKSAAKKPDGFKQLDIGLRESRRDLENFETHITFAEREAVEKIRAKTEDLHNRVLKALFPVLPPRKSKPRATEPSPNSGQRGGGR